MFKLEDHLMQKPRFPKRSLLSFFGLLAIIFASTGNSHAAGCCMKRDNTNSPWVQIDGDFKECLRLNTQRDGSDDISKPIGLIRWIIDC